MDCLQAERDTIAEREALEREEEEAAAREKARLAERKKETHQIVVERVALEEAAIRAAAQVRFWASAAVRSMGPGSKAECEVWKFHKLGAAPM